VDAWTGATRAMGRAGWSGMGKAEREEGSEGKQGWSGAEGGCEERPEEKQRIKKMPHKTGGIKTDSPLVQEEASKSGKDREMGDGEQGYKVS